MRRGYISVLILFLMPPLINSSPAFATDTRTAVNTCINTAGCTYECEAQPGYVDCLITTAGGVIIHCGATGQCYVAGRLDSPGNPTKTPVNVTPIIRGKPVQAPPPKGGKTPKKGGHPINAAPIIKGKPVQTSPGGTSTDHPILERNGGGGKSK